MLFATQSASRAVMELGGIWDFRLDDGESAAWPGARLPEPLSMPVPSSYNDLAADGRFRDFKGWAFYQRSFAVPGFLRGQRLTLRFEAVTHRARVYLNGALICEHRGGFLPFDVEITDAVTGGDELLTVAVDNTIDLSTLPAGHDNESRNVPNFDFFNYAGITRPVKLCTTPKSYIEDITVTASVEGAAARLDYSLETVGQGAASVELLDESGSVVARCAGERGTLTVENVRLWQPLDAYLYTLRTRFGEDVYELPYGVRTVAVEGKRFLINGREFYFKGYGKHEDTMPNGRGLNEAMNVKDIALMKWMGANSFRTSHYPYSEEMMRLCDREGIVVTDEVPAVGINLQMVFGDAKPQSTYRCVRTAPAHEAALRGLIDRDKNYACVVMWSIANEPDGDGEGVYEYFAPLYALARSLDPQKRPCTMASVVSTKLANDVSRRLSDVISLNRYYGWYIHGGDLTAAEAALRRELDIAEAIEQPVMFTEYGADTVAGLHDSLAGMFSEEYQSEFYKMHSRVFDEYTLCGEQVWNFADFSTSQGVIRVDGNKKGLFTRDRRPKLAVQTLRQRWLER